MSQEQKSPRNSAVRKFFQKSLENTASTVHEHFPQLTANHISILSLVGVSATVLCTALLERKTGTISKKQAFWLILLYVLSSILDGFDGTLAREIAQKHPEIVQPKIDSILHGQNVDVTGDRIGEAALALLGMVRAEQHTDTLWFISASLAAITNPLPSVLRAKTEELTPDNGQVGSPDLKIKEGGRNILESLGTRQGRFAIAIGSLLPYIKHSSGISLQAVLTLAQASANISVTIDRARKAKQAEALQQTLANTKTKESNTQIQAKTRKKVLGVVTAGILGGTTLTAAALLHKRYMAL